MKWYHRVNPDWYKARKNFLTASDIKTLWPKTKTGRDRKITELDYMKIYYEKSQEVRLDDCDSYDWAARGHILEPYAINEFSRFQKEEDKLYHWDDCLVYRNNCYIAYSPDALNIEQPFAIQLDTDLINPSIISEVKSYNAAKHIETMMIPKDETEERIQIATAMYVSKTIKEGYLILFNPEVEDVPLVWKHWDRAELQNEFNIIGDIEYRWGNFVDKVSNMSAKQLDEYCNSGGAVVFNHPCISIDEIILDYEKQQEEERRLNPPCK